MNRFAELLDRLSYEPGRNNKLRLMTDYFASTRDPERGWALAAFTGALTFQHAKPGMIRTLIAERGAGRICQRHFVARRSIDPNKISLAAPARLEPYITRSQKAYVRMVQRRSSAGDLWAD